MGWFESNNHDDVARKPRWESLQEALQPIQKRVNQQIELDRLPTAFQDPYAMAAVGCACGVSFLLGFRLGRSPSRWTRLTNMSDVPSSYVGPQAPFLKGRVVSVSDGDTVRFLHVPTRLFHSSTLQASQKVSEVALPIRICTIDTPETAKFGKEGQPFGEDAKKKLQDLAHQKMVQIRLLAKDQYGRGVAELRTGWFFWRTYADEAMLKVGLAEVYQGGGAVYGHKGKEAYFAMEEQARTRAKGIWSGKSRESAAEFKARMKAEA